MHDSENKTKNLIAGKCSILMHVFTISFLFTSVQDNFIGMIEKAKGKILYKNQSIDEEKGA
jgi:hypothetical protein